MYIYIVDRPIMALWYKRVTVNAIGCGFDSH